MIAEDNLSQSLTQLILYYVKQLEKCQQILFALLRKILYSSLHAEPVFHNMEQHCFPISSKQ